MKSAIRFTALLIILLPACIQKKSLLRDSGSQLECTDTDTLTECGIEAYLVRGDFDAARKMLKMALERDRRDETAWFVLADMSDIQGHSTEAFDAYVKTLDIIRKDKAADAASAAAASAISDAAAGALGAFVEKEPRFRKAISRMAGRIMSDPGNLSANAVFIILQLAAIEKRKQGFFDEEKKLLAASGSILDWKFSGPFGSLPFLELDRAFEPQNPGPWRRYYDLGPGRGRVATMDVDRNGRRINIISRRFSSGSFYAASTIDIPGDVKAFIRLESTDPVILMIDDVEIYRRMTHEKYMPLVSRIPVFLPAGRHKVVLRIPCRYDSAWFALAVMDARGRAVAGKSTKGARSNYGYASASGVMEKDGKIPGDVFGLYTASLGALSDGDSFRARRMIDAILEQYGESGPVLLLDAETVKKDPSLPVEEKDLRMRSSYSGALDERDDLWMAGVELALMEETAGRADNALRMLRETSKLNPDEPLVWSRLVMTALDSGWIPEAMEASEFLLDLAPDSCLAYRTAWALASKLGIAREMDRIARRLDKCDVASMMVAKRYETAGRWDDAYDEYVKAAARIPAAGSMAGSVSRSALGAGRIGKALEVLEEAGDDAALKRDPGGIVDLKFSLRGTQSAAAFALDSIATGPGPDFHMRDMKNFLDGHAVMGSYGIDGERIMNEYRDSKPGYDSASVYVLDRAVYRIFEDGSRLIRIHQIVHLLSEEGVNRNGELFLPRGVRILTLRTIKPDGRIVEPQDIEGKDSISFPELAVGDFIESEYIHAFGPSPYYGGGFDTGRFYFQDFEHTFHRSEIYVIMPQDMEYELDPRGDIPPCDKKQMGTLKVVSWRVRGPGPATAEPMGPHKNEYLPSIRITAGVDWEKYALLLSDLMMDRHRVSPAVVEQARSIVRQATQDDVDTAGRLIYEWTVSNIEEENDLESAPSHMLSDKRGSRARLVYSLLRALGHDAGLVYINPFGTDETDTDVADSGRYRILAVLAGKTLVWCGSQDAPYGFLPPALRNRPAYVLGARPRRIMTGPGSVPVDDRSVSIEISISSGGDTEARIRETLTGMHAIQWREAFRGISRRDWNRRFEENYLGSILRGAKLKDLDVIGAGDAYAPLVISYEAHLPGFARSQGQSLYVPVLYAVPLTGVFARQRYRETDLMVPATVHRSVKIHMDVGDDFRAHALPGPVDIEGSFGSFRMEYSESDTGIKLKRSLEISGGRIKPDAYEEFVNFCMQVDNAAGREIKLVSTVSR